MRKSVSRVTALVAIISALVTACAATVPRPLSTHGRDRDRAVRTTRSGAQRLDAGDGAAHGHDEAETTLASTARVPADESTPASGDQDTQPTMPEIAQFIGRHDAANAVRHTRSRRAPAPAACLDAHAPDRAPPAA
jgi:hypothetical protein